MLETFGVWQTADQESMIKRLEMKLDVNRERLDKVLPIAAQKIRHM